MSNRTKAFARLILPAALLALAAGGGHAAPRPSLPAKATGGQLVMSPADPRLMIKDSRLLAKALDKVKPGKKGKVEAFILVAGLDADPVFDREARETARVLTRRYGADGRVVLLSTGGIHAKSNATPQGSIANLGIAMAGISEKMNKGEDVFILYSTSHGAPEKGIIFKDGETATGYAAPALLKHWMDGLGIERRLLMISACFSGQFVPVLESEQSVIVTAASASRPSFGCSPGNDWTFFGDALINNALRKSQPMDAAAGEAFGLIRSWEDAFSVRYSEPQVSIGAKAATGWLSELEAKVPTNATKPVGKPAAGKLTKKAD